MLNRPQQYNIYKGVKGSWGAVQFNLQSPHFYNSDKQKDFRGNLALDSFGKLNPGWQQREGAVFVEAASTVGDNEYDWSKKIIFALSIHDMGKIATALSSSQAVNIDLMHDPKAKRDGAGEIQKHLVVFSKGAPLKTGCMLTLKEIKNKETIAEHKVPVSADEAFVVRQLLAAAIPASLNWK